MTSPNRSSMPAAELLATCSAPLIASSKAASSTHRSTSSSSSAPLLMSASKALRFTFLGSVRAHKSKRLVKGSSRRAVNRLSIGPSPKPLMAPSPYRIWPASSTENAYCPDWIEGGCTTRPMRLASSRKVRSLSVLSISELITAAINSAG